MSTDEELWTDQNLVINMTYETYAVIWTIGSFHLIDPTKASTIASKDFLAYNQRFKLSLSPKHNSPAEHKKIIPTLHVYPANFKKIDRVKIFCRFFVLDREENIYQESQFEEMSKKEASASSIKFTTIGLGPLKDQLLKNNSLKIMCHIKDTRMEASMGRELLPNFFLSKQKLLQDIGKSFADRILMDITLKVGGEEFSAHKSILASRSRTFKAILMSQPRCSHTINLEVDSPQTARAMLHFIYTGEILHLSVKSAYHLYKGSAKYELDDLKSLCRQFLINNLNTDTICTVASLAESSMDTVIYENVVQFIAENVDDVVESNEWKIHVRDKPDFFYGLMANVMRQQNTHH